MTGKEFKKEIERLEVTFIKTYTKETLEVYWEELKDMDYRTFKKACAEMRKRESFLPILSTILKYIDEAKYGRFFVPPEDLKPLTQDQIKAQEEINRKGRLRVAQTILNMPAAGSGAKEWARKVMKQFTVNGSQETDE